MNSLERTNWWIVIVASLVLIVLIVLWITTMNPFWLQSVFMVVITVALYGTVSVALRFRKRYKTGI